MKACAYGHPIAEDVGDDFTIDALDDEELLVLEPRSQYDQAILGVVRRYNDRFVLYSMRRVLQSIERDIGDDVDEGEDPATTAREHFEFNVVGGWVGENTPGFYEDDDR